MVVKYETARGLKHYFVLFFWTQIVFIALAIFIAFILVTRNFDSAIRVESFNLWLQAIVKIAIWPGAGLSQRPSLDLLAQIEIIPHVYDQFLAAATLIFFTIPKIVFFVVTAIWALTFAIKRYLKLTGAAPEK